MAEDEEAFSPGVQQLLEEEREGLREKSEKIGRVYRALDWKLQELHRDTNLPVDVIIATAKKVAWSCVIPGLKTRDVIEVLHAFYQRVYDERNAVAALIRKHQADLAQIESICANGKYDVSAMREKKDTEYQRDLARLQEIDERLRAWGLHPERIEED